MVGIKKKMKGCRSARDAGPLGGEIRHTDTNGTLIPTRKLNCRKNLSGKGLSWWVSSDGNGEIKAKEKQVHTRRIVTTFIQGRPLEDQDRYQREKRCWR